MSRFIKRLIITFIIIIVLIAISKWAYNKVSTKVDKVVTNIVKDLGLSTRR